MFKTVLFSLFACSFFNVTAMHNPCKAWEDAMEEACKTGVFDKEREALASQLSKKAGCKAATLVASKKCKELFDQAKATAYCPYKAGMQGSLPFTPYYRHELCQFVKTLNQ